MFLFTNFFSVLIPFWGMLGLWTTRVGYHNTVRLKTFNVERLQTHSFSQWEFYFYNVIFGLFQAPYYAVSNLFCTYFLPYVVLTVIVCTNDDQ